MNPFDFCHNKGVAYICVGITKVCRRKTVKPAIIRKVREAENPFTNVNASVSQVVMSMSKIMPKVSVVVPTYNESAHIGLCVNYLLAQTFNSFEIIVVDDGSTDDTVSAARKIKLIRSDVQIKVYRRNHKGPGEARNFGVQKANGDIIIFVDADMLVENQFITKIIEPIIRSRSIGADTLDGYLANNDNYWARCWNIGRFSAAGVILSVRNNSIVPRVSKVSTIFRAIRKSSFQEIGGFEHGGDYTDDESLHKKSGRTATIVRARYYHIDPGSLSEVWQRAMWIGSGENFTSTFSKKILNLVNFCFPFSLIKGIIISLRYHYLPFILFKVIYDLAIFFALAKSILA